MRLLTQYGRLNIAYKLVTNTGYPSWGYRIRRVLPPFGSSGMAILLTHLWTQEIMLCCWVTWNL